MDRPPCIFEVSKYKRLQKFFPPFADVGFLFLCSAQPSKLSNQAKIVRGEIRRIVNWIREHGNGRIIPKDTHIRQPACFLLFVCFAERFSGSGGSSFSTKDSPYSFTSTLLKTNKMKWKWVENRHGIPPRNFRTKMEMDKQVPVSCTWTPG